MTTDMTLADFVELASERNNGASGRRLAEIAATKGIDVSHSTLNRIRRGTYGSVPNSATLKAIAVLAGVAEERVIAASGAPGRTPDTIFNEWQQASARVLTLTLEYARVRGISPPDAEDELTNVLQMANQLKEGRPWTPPWRDDYEPGAEPWRAKFWVLEDTNTKLSGVAGLRKHLAAVDEAATVSDAETLNPDDEVTEEQFQVAARTAPGKSRGQLEYDRHAAAGEESQAGPDGDD